MRRKILALIVTGFRQVRVMALDIARPSTGVIIQSVRSGYHYEGRGVCKRNGDWWQGRRSIDWGPRYQPQRPEGGVSFQGPNGGEIRVRW